MSGLSTAHSADDPSAWSRLSEYSLYALLVIAPFAMGGRHPIGYLIVAGLAVAYTLCWLLHRAQFPQTRWFRSGIEPFLIAGIVLVALQLVPWPDAVYARLPVGARQWLPMSENAAELGLSPWRQLSLTPAATRQGLVLLMAYILLFVATVQHVRKVSDVQRILKWIAGAGVAMATFGIAQYLTSNGKFLWFYECPFRDTNDVVKGAFVNRNHFAHFLGLATPGLIWWLVTALKAPSKSRSPETFKGQGPASFPIWIALGLTVVLLAALLSLSRGGVGSMLIGAAVCVVLLYRANLIDKRFTIGTVAVAALVVLALSIHGSIGVLSRFDEVASASLDKLDRDSGRRKIWEADLQAVAQSPLFGTGVGSHVEVYPLFLAQPSDAPAYSHAECGYLQVAVETGLIGLGLVLGVIVFCARWCYGAALRSHSSQAQACAAAVCASLCVSALHSFVDFVWYIPACMTTTVVLAACAYRLWTLAQPDAVPSRAVVTSPTRVRYAAATLALIGPWMLSELLGPALGAPAWDRYLRLSEKASKAESIAANSAGSKDDDTAARKRQKLDAMIRELTATLRFDRTNATAYSRLAAAELQRFELLQAEAIDAMPLAAIRDAAFQSTFASQDDLDQWLDRAIGPNYELLQQAQSHAYRALSLCPLLGEAHLYLKDLSFLESSDATAKMRHLAQALRVRPFDGEVHFEAGREAFLAGDMETAIEHWRATYDNGDQFKSRLIDLFALQLSSQLPVQFFLEHFDPGVVELRLLRERYRGLQLPDQWTALLDYSAAKVIEQAEAATGAEACARWLEAESLFRELKRLDQRQRCVEAALLADPNNYWAHQAAAFCFYELEQFERAEEQLKWCLARAPNDKELKRVRDDVVRARVKSDPPRSAGKDHALR